MRFFSLAFGVLGVTAVAQGCGAASHGELEPRYVALHNAFAAMGLAQVGPIQQGSLAEGRDARVVLELPAQCTTIVALGTEGVRDLDVTLLDASGKSLAHDTTREPQAVVRACVETAGTYTLVIKMAAGAGQFVTATWAGGVGGGQANVVTASAPVGAGTCESPIVIGVGTLNASTSHGESENDGSCGSGTARELVYRLEVPARQRVTIDVDPHFDAVIYLRKGECSDQDADAEVACNDDDAHHGHSSKLDTVLDAGSYFLFVDGVGNEAGSFRMAVAMADAPTLADVCKQARPLALGAVNTGSVEAGFDHVQASCGEGAPGPDSVYKIDVPQRSRIRLIQHMDDAPPVVHLRRLCADEQTEVGCSDASTVDDEAAYVGILDPGSYAVFADSSDRQATGRFNLAMEMSPEQGSGAVGDGCGDAVKLGRDETTVTGDTFLAHDDVGGRCGGAGAADVVYRVDLAKRARVTARFNTEEGKHVFILSRSCGDKSSEITCGEEVDETLPAGSYSLAVDGATPDGIGKFELEWRVRDVGGQEAACRGATTLRDGQVVAASTVGGGDNFETSCAGREDGQASPDRVYKIVLGARSKIKLSLQTAGWDGVIALRRSCLDASGSTSPRAAELACNNDTDDVHHAGLENTLDAGTYFVVVDGHASGNEGQFSLRYAVSK